MNTITVNEQQITPSKIICVGRNYVDHIQELGNEIPDDMVVFLKPNSAISCQLNATHNNDILHYEAELCFVYQQGRFSAIGFGLDLTKRKLQAVLKNKGLPWERAKAFDGAAVFSDFVSIANMNDDFCLQLDINGRSQQSGGTSLMMYKPAEILAQLQTFMTLVEGDVVMTGTPKGVGEITLADDFYAEVSSKQKDKPDKRLVTQHWRAH